ncbi:MAG: molybdenum cofactor guanylyltransferase [Bacteroidales bacterium]
MNITGIVLAGGRSVRFGSNKAISMFQNKTMIKHSIDLLAKFCDQVIISGDKEEYVRYGYPCIPDKYENIGPLGGVCSSLEASPTDVNVVVTCDMPLVTEEMIRKLLEAHQSGKITVFDRDNNDIYPFPGIYEKTHLPLLTDIIHSGKYQIREAINRNEGIRVPLESDEVICMSNVNTNDELLSLEKCKI